MNSELNLSNAYNWIDYEPDAVISENEFPIWVAPILPQLHARPSHSQHETMSATAPMKTQGSMFLLGQKIIMVIKSINKYK